MYLLRLRGLVFLTFLLKQRASFGLVLFALLLAETVWAQTAITASTRVEAAGLQQDVAILRAAFEQMHPGLYRYNTKAQMDANFRSLQQDLARDRTLEQTYLALSLFTAKIRCGHTYPNFFNQSKAVSTALFERTDKLPFFFRWIDGRMIVTRDFTAEHRLPVGSEVIAINGVAAQDVLKRLLPLVRGDGGNDAKRIDLLQVQGEAAYDAVDVYLPMVFAEWRSPFRLEVKTGREQKASLVVAPALSYAERKAAVSAGHADSSAAQALFTLRYTEGGAALLTMPTWGMYYSKWDWKGWLNASLDEASKREAPALIVDLRGNEGGDDVGAVILRRLRVSASEEKPYARLVRYRKAPEALLPYLDTWDPSFKDWGAKASELAEPWATAPPVPYLRQSAEEAEDVRAAAAARHFAGRVFVLTNASNSSATFGFARAIQEEHLGQLVGEPTGGNKRGINGGAFFFLKLPHTGLEVDLPLIGYFPATPQRDEGITPDVLVKLSADDLAAGRDPVLKKVQELMAGKR